MKKNEASNKSAIYCRVGNKETGKKTAIIYCCATNLEFAERQQKKAEAKAKELSATVEDVFIDIVHAKKYNFLQRVVRRFKYGKLRKICWLQATAYLKEHKIDYVIMQKPSRLSRDKKEYQKMVEGIRGCGAYLVFFDVPHEEI